METRRIERKILKKAIKIRFHLLRLRVLKNVHVPITIVRVKTYLTLSFTYVFDTPNDTV